MRTNEKEIATPNEIAEIVINKTIRETANDKFAFLKILKINISAAIAMDRANNLAKAPNGVEHAIDKLVEEGGKE